MAYKISGTLNESARILVLKESDWSIESNVEKSAGDYEIENLVSGTKTVVAIDGNGEVVGYGMVSPEFYGGDRGVFGGGKNNESTVNTIEYITISIFGNATDFGDLVISRYRLSATSNGINDRGVFGGGSDVNRYTVNIISYITISSLSNATDFGDLTIGRNSLAAASNGTNDRGVFGCGYADNYSNVIDYITISTTGNATDFGDLTVKRSRITATSNAVNDRAVFGGGHSMIAGHYYHDTIDYITISSLGNALDFGNLTLSRGYIGATSNGINNRGVFGGGYYDDVYSNVIDYITISTTGNATDFGDLTSARLNAGATSNGTNDRGVFAGGGGNSGYVNIIDYITISSLENATDFGDLTVDKASVAATSNV